MDHLLFHSGDSNMRQQLKDQDGMRAELAAYLGKDEVPESHKFKTGDGEFVFTYKTYCDTELRKGVYGTRAVVHIKTASDNDEGKPIYYTGDSVVAFEKLCPGQNCDITLGYHYH